MILTKSSKSKNQVVHEQKFKDPRVACRDACRTAHWVADRGSHRVACMGAHKVVHRVPHKYLLLFIIGYPSNHRFSG